jgi:hypothetical protein
MMMMMMISKHYQLTEAESENNLPLNTKKVNNKSVTGKCQCINKGTMMMMMMMISIHYKLTEAESENNLTLNTKKVNNKSVTGLSV